MDTILQFFVRQKKLALVFTLATIVAGALSLFNIQRDQFPAVDFEVMSIITAYPGASPEDVEQNVTNLVEDEIKNITDIDKFTSVSSEAKSNIIITFSQDVDDIETSKQAVRNAVNRVKSLPAEVLDLPEVVDHRNSLRSILKVNVSLKNSDFVQLRKTTDEIARTLELLDGVSEVVKEGYLKAEIQIRLDAAKLTQYKLSLVDVITAIERRNKRFTVGSNHDYDNEKTIVVLAKFADAEDVREVIVKSTFEGPVIRLKDIATVSRGNIDRRSITRINSSDGFVLKIRKQERADIIETIDLIKKTVDKIQSNNDSLRIFYSSDSSKYVRNRLKIVTNNGLIGLALVLVVLGVFLSFKTAFWVSVSLPVSLLGALALLAAIGETINLVSLAGMILVLGIVVDDSIIVAESIHHYRSLGEDRYKAAVHGFRRVIMPVITTILTTIFAFSSMFLMDGTMGKFIYVIPLVVIFALSLSFLEVSFALPAHLASSKSKTSTKTWFLAVENWFVKFLKKALHKRYWVLVIFTTTLIASVFFAATNMKFVLFPAVGADVINAKLEMPPGSSLERTFDVSKQVENLITTVVGEDLDSLTNTVGGDFSHIAKFTIGLVPSGVRLQDSNILLKKLKARITEVKQVKKLTFSVKRPGPPQGEDIEIILVGEDNNQRQTAAANLSKILSKIKGVDNISRDDEPGKSRIEVVLDFEKMARLNIDFFTVNRYLRSAFTGVDVTNIRDGDDDVEFRLYLGENEQHEDFIKQLKISNRKNYLVPLEQFSKVRQIDGEPDFNHFNGLRSTAITASINDEENTSALVISTALSQLNLAKKYPAIKSFSEGGGKETQKSMASFRKAFMMAVFAIFLLLVLLFNSYSQPLLVLSAIPFAVIGVIWAFFLHGNDLSFFAVLGSLALIGVIVNDSLVMVSHLNHLKSQSSPQTPAIEWVIIGAKDRLRAVVLTTLTTLAGVIPLAYGIGGTDFILQPMALSLGYGLLFGTLMTLILLPCLYLINHEFINWLQSLKSRFIIQNN